MAQLAKPISDVNHPNWTQGAGDGNATHFEELDEGIASADDATTYWQHSSGAGGGNPIESNVTSLTDPSSSVSHVLRTRERKSATGGKVLDILCALACSSGVVLVFDNKSLAANFDTTTWTTHTYTLSGAEADAITDYTTISIATKVAWSGGGAARVAHVTAHEFECPDAGGGGGRTTKNTRAFPLGTEVGMNWRGAA